MCCRIFFMCCASDVQRRLALQLEARVVQDAGAVREGLAEGITGERLVLPLLVGEVFLHAAGDPGREAEIDDAQESRENCGHKNPTADQDTHSRRQPDGSRGRQPVYLGCGVAVLLYRPLPNRSRAEKSHSRGNGRGDPTGVPAHRPLPEGEGRIDGEHAAAHAHHRHRADACGPVCASTLPTDDGSQYDRVEDARAHRGLPLV
mmetsp:Transcript_8091/g.19043  ORF Transcript_8091/g.19043 Transcript_8091/m.19043 type:complete len:204 (+) Transcript_8091:203-814(+)